MKFIPDGHAQPDNVMFAPLVIKGETVGLRMPNHPIALLLLEEVGEPVFAPSANFSEEKAPVNALEVLKALDKKIDVLIDSGESELKASSTVCKVTNEGFEILVFGKSSEKVHDKRTFSYS